MIDKLDVKENRTKEKQISIMHDQIRNEMTILKPNAVGDGNLDDEQFTITGTQAFFKYKTDNQPLHLRNLKGLNQLIIFPELYTKAAHQFILKSTITNML